MNLRSSCQRMDKTATELQVRVVNNATNPPTYLPTTFSLILRLPDRSLARYQFSCRTLSAHSVHQLPQRHFLDV